MQKIVSEIGCLEHHELLEETYVAVAAHFDVDKKQFEWMRDQENALNISGIEGAKSYRPPSRSGYDYGDEDHGSYPLLVFDGQDKQFDLRLFSPERYSSFYRYGYKTPILCQLM